MVGKDETVFRSLTNTIRVEFEIVTDFIMLLFTLIPSETRLRGLIG